MVDEVGMVIYIPLWYLLIAPMGCGVSNQPMFIYIPLWYLLILLGINLDFLMLLFTFHYGIY